ncbi:hypothetical protein [Amaricoccus solimangrovi]|uniref:Uncharacterized protein n=1 Tax=Amaricoccus solimangrovi TaxID=2589815 RepID=A0A501W963_9RHOB|nr:hypothetical protein [Amaricoccus solimangrovi]TPE45075.1 hypothetical protein FJM51_22770 [Amaricoccus solimangrovi]
MPNESRIRTPTPACLSGQPRALARASASLLLDAVHIWRLARAERRVFRACAARLRADDDLRRARHRHGALLRGDSR